MKKASGTKQTNSGMPSKLNRVYAAMLLVFASSQVLAEVSDGPPACKYCPEMDGWTGWIEGGVGYQSDDDARFGRYNGYYEEGAKVNVNGDLLYRTEDGMFIDGIIEDLGLDSRRVRIEAGKQGSYEIGVEYDQIPNYREDGTQTPYRNLGNGLLELPNSWISGPTTDQMPNLNSSLKDITLETERRRTGANFKFLPMRGWELSGYARHEVKDGVKDVGATFSFDQTVILPIPFEYTTDDFGLTLGYHDDKFQGQISYTASLFDNDNDSITWRNPYVDDTSDIAYGRMAENPDNEFHQLSAILGYQILPSTSITGRFSRGVMTQDADLLPYSINPNFTGTPPTKTAQAEVNTTLASVSVNSRPIKRLQLEGSYTYSDRDNKTPINTYNIITTDVGSGGQRKNRPYSMEQNVFKLKAKYQLPKRTYVSLGYDDDRKDRTYTYVEETHDKILWGKIRFQPTTNLEASLKYTHAKRDAGNYTPLSEIDPLFDNPNENFYNNPLMRAHHLSDRTRNQLGAWFSYMPVHTLSLNLDLDYYQDDYDDMYLGLQEASGHIATMSASAALTETLTATAYYTYDRLSSDEKGSEKMLATDPDNYWISSNTNRTDTVGFGVNWIVIEDELDIGLETAYAEYIGEIEFDNAQALPDFKSELTSVNLHANYQFSESLSIRAEYRYERYTEEDWTRSGLADDIPTLIALGQDDRDTSTSLAFLTLRYKL